MRSMLRVSRPVTKVLAGAVALVLLAGAATIGLAAASPGSSAPTPSPSAVVYTTLALTNGWSNYGFGTRKAAVFKDASGVHFKGAIATAGSDARPFTLPKAFRPGGTVYLPVDLCNATNGRLVITKTGTVTVEAEGGNFNNASCFTSLEGVSFTP